MPTVDDAATYDPDKRMVYLSIVNNDQERPAAIRIEGLERSGEAKVFRVNGDRATVLNTEDDPTAFVIEESSWPAGTDVMKVPPLSFSMVNISLAID